MSDPFEEAYTAGIADEIAPPAGPVRARIKPAEPFALRGCILTPERKIEDGYVEVVGSTIRRVGTAKPAAGLRVIDTGKGVILPGLIDLHGHPEYNVFAAWEPPKQYLNRGQWRRSKEYAAVVKTPWKTLKPLHRQLTRYAEIRALVAGVTAIQGASVDYPQEEALVRNVDLRIFGQHRARTSIDLKRDEAKWPKWKADIAAGVVTALYVHLAEGVDEKSTREFDELVGADLLTPATVIIHGTALTPAQLMQVRDAGARMVWSPQSNLRLYGKTTNLAEALRLEIPVGLGADWLPSGSPNLLGELKIARREIAQQHGRITPKQLVQTVTVRAAEIAGLGQHLGRLEKTRPADLLVLERRRDDPWENVIDADPSWVDLVTINGDLAYGRPDWIKRLAVADEPDPKLEPVLAWGKPMLLDTSYVVQSLEAPRPRLSAIRADLIAKYPQVGPIFA
jgi:5-methylthioadenosine/S-adenosylhomocysteine deaminase